MGDIKELPSRKLVGSHKGGFNKPFENQTTCNDERVDTKKRPGPPSPLVLFLMSYFLWPQGSVNYTHSA